MNNLQWKIIDTGSAHPDENMKIDAELLDSYSHDQIGPILHLYNWSSPSATFGYFTNPFEFLSKTGIEKRGLQLARRPTGGGIIFHLTDFAFSILVPAAHPGYFTNTLDNYAYVNSLVIDAVKRFSIQKSTPELLSDEPQALHPQSKHFCMAHPTKYDVILNGRKVGGGAQRRTKHAYLHQGTISLAFPNEAWLSSIIAEPKVLEAMRRTTYTLLPDNPPKVVEEARMHLSSILKGLINELNLETCPI